MPKGRFHVHSLGGRQVATVGGLRPPNRISAFFSHLSDQWLEKGSRPHIQLPAPSGGWMRYALTFAPGTIFARCQDTSSHAVMEQVFHRQAKDDVSLDRDIRPRFAAFQETYREGLERAYGWPGRHSWLPPYLPWHDGITLMETLYQRYGNLTLLMGAGLALLTGWSESQVVLDEALHRSGPVAPNRLFIEHGYRWRGAPGYGLAENQNLLLYAAKRLAAPWPLTGNEDA